MLLDIVKKHHDLIKKEYHSLDLQVARDLGKECTADPTVTKNHSEKERREGRVGKEKLTEHFSRTVP